MENEEKFFTAAAANKDEITTILKHISKCLAPCAQPHRRNFFQDPTKYSKKSTTTVTVGTSHTARTVTAGGLQMSYPRDLDEIPEEELRKEIERRQTARSEGKCDYCGRAVVESPCRFPKRHSADDSVWAVVDTDNFAGDYPNEKFVGGTETGVTKVVAEILAATHNDKMTDYSPRFWRVVRLPYTIQPGFEP